LALLILFLFENTILFCREIVNKKFILELIFLQKFAAERLRLKALNKQQKSTNALP